MSRPPRILIEVTEDFRNRLHRYARADRRTIRQIVMMAVDEFMRQNPAMDESSYDKYEKR